MNAKNAKNVKNAKKMLVRVFGVLYFCLQLIT